MTEITRYESGHDDMERDFYDGCRVREDGPLVSYEDHAAIVAEKDAQIAELKLRNKGVIETYLISTINEHNASCKLSALHEQVRALAAENVKFKGLVLDITLMKDDDFFGSTPEAQRLMGALVNVNIQSTDAAIREIRAQVLDDMADDCQSDWPDTCVDELRASASRIRAGDKP